MGVLNCIRDNILRFCTPGWREG